MCQLAASFESVAVGGGGGHPVGRRLKNLTHTILLTISLISDGSGMQRLARGVAMMFVADRQVTLTVTGNGDVLEPEHGVIAIGSGGNYALAAARALADTDYDAEEIARRAMKIAGEICIYTNDNVVVESLDETA